MERTITEEFSSHDWESRLDFSPVQTWDNEGPHWASDLPDLALPAESLGLDEAAFALPVLPDAPSPATQTLSAKMKLGVATSALAHSLLLGAALLSLYWIAPLEAGDVDSVSVDIVQTQEVLANAASAMESEQTEAMTSAGAEAIEPVDAEEVSEVPPVETQTTETLTPVEVQELTQPVEQVTPEAAEPTEPVTEPTPVEPTPPTETAEAPPPETVQPAETAAAEEPTPVEAASVAAEVPVLAAAAISPLPPLETVAPVEPVSQIEPLDAVETPAVHEKVEATADAAPVPMTRTVKQTTEPTYPKTPPKKPETQKPTAQKPDTKKPETQKPAPKAEQPTKKPVTTPPTKRVASQGGNGGKDNIDTQASAQSAASRASTASGGGSAASYPGKVRAALGRATRYRGAKGEVSVRFTISANGNVSNSYIVASSGNEKLDAAVLQAITRAAPYPPIPADAGRTSWTLEFPVTAGGR